MHTFILIFHESLYIPDLESHLLCPFQLRSNGLEINDCPLQFLPPHQRSLEAHSIVTPTLRIPLSLFGITSYFPVRLPTEEEILDSIRFTHIEMTADTPWQPHDITFSHDEDSLRNFSPISNEPPRMISIVSAQLSNISNVLDDDNLLHLLTHEVVYTTSSLRIGASVSNRKGTVQASDLAKRWFIGVEAAKRTVERTTQRGVRDFSHTGGTRRLKHTSYQLRFRHLRSSVYTDTMFSPKKSSNQNTCAQVYVTPFHWTKVYPIRKKGDAHLTLTRLFHDVGVFHTFIPDNAPELVEGEFRRKVQHAGAMLKPVEAYSHNQNLAESAIRELRRMYRKAMISTNSPHILWDHCIELMAEIRSHTSLDLFDLQGDTPVTRLTGDTPDISHLCEFAWYDIVWYIDTMDKLQNKKLARYLGPSHDIGQAMSAKLLKSNGYEISRTSVIPLSVEDKHNPNITAQIDEFNKSLNAALGDRATGITVDESDDIEEYEPYEDDERPPVMIPEADTYDDDSYHKFISARVIIPTSGEAKKGKVLRRKRDEDGNLIGTANPNPIIDSSVYEVEFDDGHVEAFAANAIAEAIYAQVDDEGNIYDILDEITDHKKTAEAISNDDSFTMLNGKKHPRKTTKGWKLCVRWKDGSSSWVRLADLKESNPVQLAEYAIANKLVSEAAFSWWVPHVIRKRERIISKLKTRYIKREQKFGILLPKTVKQALEFDRESNTTFWADALKKEMGVILPAVDILEAGSSPPVGFSMIPCHVVFDVKMDFTRKARFVAGGHVTDPPTTQTYASVVSRDSVRIAFLLAALNELDVLTADIQGAYLNAPCKEKVYTICGYEFGPEYKGRIAVITKALYGLKTSAFAWREHLSGTIRDSLDFTSCLADCDVWMRPATKPDGSKYYDYLLVYTDDLLVISHDPRSILTTLDQHYLLKPNSIGPPTQYLGAQVGEYQLSDDPSRRRWYMSSEKYVKEAVRNIKVWMEERGRVLKPRAPCVLPTGYRPEMDVTPYCNDDEANYYQQQIGVLRWAVELGRIDIACEVSMLAAYTAAPRQGHFIAMLHMYSYLSQHDRSKVVLDDSYVPVNDELDADWKAFYPDAVEDIPSNAPEPRGKPVQMIVFVDADHAADLQTRRSRTGILLYLNRAPILWYSKRQNSVETSTFGSEFVALKTAVEIVKGMRYKLRMMGVELEGHAHMRVDNMSVVRNTSTPESTLKKKSNAIAYHFVREAVAADIARIAYEPTGSNKADMLTKTQNGPERTKIMQSVLY